MALISLKTEDNGAVQSYDNQYGYGTCIRLSEEQVEALGLKDNPPAVGAQVGVTAIAIVQRVMQNVSTDGDEDGIDVCLELQLTDMEVTGSAAKPAPSLYD
jgi:hypothetical protein